MMQKTKQKPDPIELIKRYFNLLWKKKIWIITISIVVSILWVVIFKFVIQKQKEFTSTAVIKFEDPRARYVGALTEFANIGAEGNVAILQSGSFLSTVVDSLRLNLFLRTPNISRFEFFKYINTNEQANYGNYDIKLNNNSVILLYANNKKEIENKLVQKIILPESGTIDFSITGLNFGIDKKLLLQLKSIKLGLNPKAVAVDYLKGKLITALDRATHTLLTLSFSSTHPFDAAEILNIITNMYINKLLEVKRFRTLNVLNSLEEQLSVAKTELEISERRLQGFRERNPYLFLSDAGSELVSGLSEAQASINQNSIIIQRLTSAINEINSDASNNDRLYLNLMDILVEHNVLGVQQLLSQFNNLLAEKSNLLSAGYSMQSLQVEETQNKILSVKNNIINKANNLLNKLNSTNSEFQSSLTVNQKRLNRLPQNEIRIAELQRDREVKAQIYSNILIRYNEAKISDAAVIPDALLIDEAETPIDYGGSNFLIYLIGPFLGFFLAGGVFIGLDLLNSNIRETSDIEDKIGVPVLATIPVILHDSDVPEKLGKDRELDPKLITSSYAPTIASEKFRLLRTKLSIDGNKSNSIIMTSLSANEGKSLITSNLAITFAQLKIPTILLDCDLRRGVLHNSFNCNKKPGISDILLKNVPITSEEISNLIQNTHVPNLFLISSGMQIPNPSELLGGLRMQQFLDLLEKKFSKIIIDTPPLDIIPDALILNSIVHNFIFVVRYNRTKISRFLNKLEEYASIKDDLRGVIINGVQDTQESEYHSYSYYHY